MARVSSEPDRVWSTHWKSFNGLKRMGDISEHILPLLLYNNRPFTNRVTDYIVNESFTFIDVIT